MDRVKTLKLNIFTSILPWLILAIIGFVRISFFVNTYGSELNGYIQFVGQIYGYLTLIEMGFGLAITYKLYKPLAADDKEEIAKLVNGSKKIYKKIVIQMSVIVVIIATILPYIISRQTITNFEMIYLFSLFSTEYIVKYIYYLPYATLMSANQKKYKVNIIMNIATILVKITELMLIFSTIPFTYVLTISTVMNIGAYLIFNKIARKQYAYIENTKEADTSPKKMSKDIMWFKISNIVFYSTDNIIIVMTKSLGLAMASIYSSYNYIICAIRNILDVLFSSSPLELLGSKFAKDGVENKNSEALYKEIQSASYVIGIVISTVFLVSASSFVSLWINANYAIDIFTSIAFALYIWYECITRPISTIIEANGKYKETKYIEFSSAVINLLLSLVLVRFFGLAGIMIATVIAIACVKYPFELKFLYKDLFKVRLSKNILAHIIYTLGLVACGLLNIYLVKVYQLYPSNGTYLSWGITTVVLTLIDSIAVIVPALIFDKSFNKVVKRVVIRKKS